jgi:hypothetical protein
VTAKYYDLRGSITEVYERNDPYVVAHDPNCPGRYAVIHEDYPTDPVEVFDESDLPYENYGMARQKAWQENEQYWANIDPQTMGWKRV